MFAWCRRASGLLACLVFLATSQAQATEVQMSGDARMYGSFWQQKLFNNLDTTGTRAFSNFAVYERFRLKTDFIANENLKFRFQVRVDDTAWGYGTFTYDNPQVSLQVQNAYLQFKFPNTDFKATIGAQDFSMPASSLFAGSVVLTTDNATAANFELPLLGDTLGLQFGYARLLKGNAFGTQSGRPSDQAMADGLDNFHMALPIKLEDAKLTFIPWAMISLMGSNAGYDLVGVGTQYSTFNAANNLQSLGAYWPNANTLGTLNDANAMFAAATGDANSTALLSAVALQQVASRTGNPSDTLNVFTASNSVLPLLPADAQMAYSQYLFTQLPRKLSSFRNNLNLGSWAGVSFEVEPFENLKVGIDASYGQVNMADRERNRRRGFFGAAAVEYSGFDCLTPYASAWFGTGEDSSLRNGSERLPVFVSSFNAGNSFLFDGGQAFANGHLGIAPMGTWGVSLSTGKMSFLEHLTHTVTVAYTRGTNDPRPLRISRQYLGDGVFYRMGRDLTVNEGVISVTFDHRYKIYENLAAIVETGYAHGNFQESVWGRRMVRDSRNGDVWKAQFGLDYKF